MTRYIYDRHDWPAFRWDEKAIVLEAADLAFRQGLLIGRLEALGFGDRREATLEALIQEVRRSSEIEGEHLDALEVRSSIGKRLGTDVAGLPVSDRHVDGIVEIVLDATQNFAEPLNRERLWAWHASLFPEPRHRGDRLRIGQWRDDATGPMQVVSGALGREKVHYEAPSALQLDAEMERFLDWFQDAEVKPGVAKAGVAHLWFETLHPFDDGNGRIGRAIMGMALARAESRAWRGYSLSAQIRKERSRYYDALEQAQHGDMDITPWLAWFVGCLSRAVEASEEILEGVLSRSRFWRAHEGKTISERQRKVLKRVLDDFQGKLTSSKWAELAKVSHDSALRDLSDLVAKGVLIRDEAGGRSTAYSFAPVEP